MIVSLVLMLATALFAANLAFARPRKFSLFLLAASVLAFGADTDGLAGLANLSAIWLLCLIALSLLAIARLGNQRLPTSASEVCYFLFLGWCAIEAFRAAETGYAVRTFLRLSFPFLSMYLARRSFDSSMLASTLVRCQLGATFSSGLISCGMMILPAAFGWVVQLVWYGAVFFDHATIIAMLALAVWSTRRDIKSLLVAIFLIAICFRAVNRTTMMALAAGGSLFCLIEFRKLAVLLLPALYAGLLAVFLLVPSFREKMFYAPDKVDDSKLLSSQELDSSQINNNGRFAMWDVVLSRFFKPNPLLGSGLGSTQAWFYSGAAKEAGCGNLKVEHSEYVRLLSDTGLIGAGLFVLAIGAAGLAAFRALCRSQEPMAHAFSVAAVCAVPVFLICMGFDNALLYVLPAAQFPFALSGIASRLSSVKSAEPVEASRTPGVRWLPLQPLRAKPAVV